LVEPVESTVAYPDPYILALPRIWSHKYERRIRILLSSSKNSKKNLDPTDFFMTFLSLKNDVNVPSKRIKQKTLEANFLVAVLKVSDENGRIRSRIRIRTKMSQIRNTGEELPSAIKQRELERNIGYAVFLVQILGGGRFIKFYIGVSRVDLKPKS
jgi:hypothetical protein